MFLGCSAFLARLLSLILSTRISIFRRVGHAFLDLFIFSSPFKSFLLFSFRDSFLAHLLHSGMERGCGLDCRLALSILAFIALYEKALCIVAIAGEECGG